MLLVCEKCVANACDVDSGRTHGDKYHDPDSSRCSDGYHRPFLESAQAAEHEVRMSNKGPDGQAMQFDPAFLKIEPGIP